MPIDLRALAGRADAERALTTAIGRQAPCWLLIAVADDVPALNEKYGYARGDAELELMARAIAVAAAGAPVYRWTATSFIVLADKKPVVDSWACRTMTIRLMRLTAAASANAVAAFIDSHVALQLAAAA